MKWNSLLCSMLVLLCTSLYAQQSLWTDIDEASIPEVGTRYITASDYRALHLDITNLQAVLDVAPMEFSPIAQVSTTLLEIPMPDGSSETFRITESPIIATELAQKYPGINTYNGYAVNDPGKYIRLDLTPKGFHAMVLVAGGKTVFIDPYSFGGGDLEHYICYYRKDFQPVFPKNFECHFADGKSISTPSEKSFGNCELLTYRLALAATGEYTQFHGGTKADALAAQVVSMNRVNAVYERDIAIRMVIVADNDKVIFTNGGSDPFTNNSGGTMLGQNQNVCDDSIGTANYDIGHVFSTGGGGIASLYAPCDNGRKARGVTGSSNPVGDPFDIDYVAHEMGHQFGATHTQGNSCNRSGVSAMEPGSASTIMGYAGICSPNVQSNSDDYFHSVSLGQIADFITDANHTCPADTALANNAPVVTTTSGSYTIPKSTPFYLAAQGSDQDANTLTYCWEQYDNDAAPMPPQATSVFGPNFRSFNPSTDSIRYFPRLFAQANNGPFTWERLPSVARSMNFRVTLRDNAPGGGCSDHADVVVNVDANSGPFVVTYPNATGISWIGTTLKTVTWEVANTNQSPVNCTSVDILLSTDGGLTFDTMLLANTPNDGAEQITVPNISSNTCRIMVRARDGVFLDISNNNFAIDTATFSYYVEVEEETIGACPNSTADYIVDVGSLLGYTDQVTLSASGLPAGVTANFSANPVTPADTVTLSLSGLSGLSAGNYSFSLDATSTSGQESVNLDLEVYAATLNAVSLNTPADGSSQVFQPVNFSWSALSTSGVTYSIDIATDPSFTNLVDNASGLTTNNYYGETLDPDNTHYWRVTASNPCTSAPSSNDFVFYAAKCQTIMSTDVPKTISGSGLPVVFSSLTLPDLGDVIDLNVVDLQATHSAITDLTVRLTDPSGTIVELFDGICNNEDDLDLSLDDDSNNSTFDCPPASGDAYQPLENLSNFHGQNPQGEWRLSIFDNVTANDGQLTAWGIEVCTSPKTATEQIELSDNWMQIIPNPNSGVFLVQMGLETQANTTLSVVNTLGQLLKTYQLTQKTNSLSIDIQNQPAGIYYIVLRSENEIITRKVTVR